MLCNEGDDNLPYSDNSFFSPIFLLDIFETKELDKNELTWEYAHIWLDFIESVWFSKFWHTEISRTLWWIEVLEDKKS